MQTYLTARRSFNSTLVRLEESRRICACPNVGIGFNSTLVRLEALGEIYDHIADACFNSTLVRLEGVPPVAARPMDARFNSTLVRLEEMNDGMCAFCASLLASFNSTLVRLEAAAVTPVSGRDFRFQFHSGSIRSPPHSLLIALETGFQFHSGSIRRAARFHGLRLMDIVSIPLWFD